MKGGVDRRLGSPVEEEQRSVGWGVGFGRVLEPQRKQ